MKLKRFLSAAAAVFASAAVCAASVFALDDGQATYCFDTNAALTEWQTYGSVEQTGFAMTHTAAVSKNGNGSIVISENVSDEIENQSGGAYITAEALGLESFQGCTVEMSVLLCEGAEGFYDDLSLYTDGMIWLTSPAEALSETEWTTVTLVIPENADNSKVGFTLPTYLLHKGDIVYIDDFSVTTPDGSIIANRGDYAVKTVTSAEKVSTGTNITLTVILVVLILAIVGGIGFIVSSAIKKFS